jgi:hypothetical protein
MKKRRIRVNIQNQILKTKGQNYNPKVKDNPMSNRKSFCILPCHFDFSLLPFDLQTQSSLSPDPR